MGFWVIQQPAEALAAIDCRDGRGWTYGELCAETGRIKELLPKLGRKPLGLLIGQNRLECLAVYLAALNSGSALMLLDATLNPVLLTDLIELYRPDWIFSMSSSEYSGYRASSSGHPGLFDREMPEPLDLYPDLAVLLNTSGSTGSPKLVRLTLANLQANADSIAEYLQLTPSDRPITSLPMSYSYGLSVINTHLQVGATLVLTDDGVLRREFWEAVDRYGCTSFAGVPYTYQMLLQTGLLSKKGATLKVWTQAGGRLDERYIRQIYELACARGSRFFVMYGQTEATARISYVPWEQLGRKIGSVGMAIPRGSLQVDEPTGELIYSGPNVMLGYAECREDLAKGDELHGELRTGDLARQDDDGYFYITGRLKRFLKLFGKRFNLDDAERILGRRFNTAVACFGRDDLLMVAIVNCTDAGAATNIVCETFDLPRTAVKVNAVKELPQTVNGKLDYQRLANVEGERPLAVAR